MDIASVATGLSQARVMNEVSTAVLAKTMDTTRSQGQGLVNMIDSAAMERSVNPSVGGSFDMKV
ncbi:MAG: YjfB family protein [Lachnospiraceae bacterium]|nr:YjfB family protein [Lachnospiraceae bacterium]MCR5255707.1 YjfB family protein [Acetatifactor sp.]